MQGHTLVQSFGITAPQAERQTRLGTALRAPLAACRRQMGAFIFVFSLCSGGAPTPLGSQARGRAQRVGGASSGAHFPVNNKPRESAGERIECMERVTSLRAARRSVHAYEQSVHSTRIVHIRTQHSAVVQVRGWPKINNATLCFVVLLPLAHLHDFKRTARLQRLQRLLRLLRLQSAD